MEGLRTVKDTEQPLCARCWRCMIICDDWCTSCTTLEQLTRFPTRTYHTYDPDSESRNALGHSKPFPELPGIRFWTCLMLLQGLYVTKSNRDQNLDLRSWFTIRTYHTYGLGVKISTSGPSETLKKIANPSELLGIWFWAGLQRYQHL